MHGALAGAGLLSDGTATRGRKKKKIIIPEFSGTCWQPARQAGPHGGRGGSAGRPSQHEQLDKLTSTPLTEGRGTEVQSERHGRVMTMGGECVLGRYAA